MNNDSVTRTKKLMTVSVTTAMMMSAAIIVTTTFLSSSSSILMIQKASAQMMGPPPSSGIAAGRMGPGMMAAPNITGSVNLTTTIGNALASQIKVGLSQAAAAAEKAVGNNSHAVSAHLGEANGYLVYTVLLVDSSYKFHKAIVDVASGQVLSNQQIPMGVGPSSMGMMMQHGMMMGHGMMGGGGMGPGRW
jgi:uncharacterized membrane protein YkoI